MVNEAIAKITKEMMEASHPFAQFIEEYLTEICVNEAVAGKLLNPEKNLKEFTKNVEAEEAEERAAAAERKLSAVKNEDLVIFKVKADELQRIFEDILQLIRDIEEADAEQAVKLRGALEKLVGALESRI